MSAERYNFFMTVNSKKRLFLVFLIFVLQAQNPTLFLYPKSLQNDY